MVLLNDFELTALAEDSSGSVHMLAVFPNSKMRFACGSNMGEAFSYIRLQDHRSLSCPQCTAIVDHSFYFLTDDLS